MIEAKLQLEIEEKSPLFTLFYKFVVEEDSRRLQVLPPFKKFIDSYQDSAGQPRNDSSELLKSVMVVINERCVSQRANRS